MNAQQKRMYEDTFQRYCKLGAEELEYYVEGTLYVVKPGMEKELTENKRQQLRLAEMLDDLSHGRNSLEPME